MSELSTQTVCKTPRQGAPEPAPKPMTTPTPRLSLGMSDNANHHTMPGCRRCFQHNSTTQTASQTTSQDGLDGVQMWIPMTLSWQRLCIQTSGVHLQQHKQQNSTQTGIKPCKAPQSSLHCPACLQDIHAPNPMWSTHGDVNTNAKLRTTPEDVVKAQWNRSGAPRMHSTPRSGLITPDAASKSDQSMLICIRVFPTVGSQHAHAKRRSNRLTCRSGPR